MKPDAPDPKGGFIQDDPERRGHGPARNMTSHAPDRPEPPDPMGKRWSEKGTPAGPQAFGVEAKPETPALSGTSSDTSLSYPDRSILALREQFASEVLQIIRFRGEWTVVMRHERLLEFMKFLRDTWKYAMCHDVTAVDLYPDEPRFMLVYHLLSLEASARLRVKCPVSGEHPEIDSLVPLWTGAEYTEREVYDMFGITFRGHPDLRRILMMEDYAHFPMRKDFPLTGFPVGIDAVKDA
jgi:NADH-quinone oxidoreductase subunit C